MPQLTPLPDFPEQASEVLAGLVVVSAREPVAFFAYPQQPSRLLPAGGAA